MDYEELESEELETNKTCDNRSHVPTMKISSDLEVNIGNKNKTIYVVPEKLQYFTASALCSSDNGKIEIEYCGCNIKWICDEAFICGRLGFYKIVKSGIIFIPKRKLSKFIDCCYPSDILHFKAKDRCGEEIEFIVVFTLSKRCEDRKNHCCCK
ncbi:hypothetical protein GKZ28_15470 [Clostridium chromiireducens]|uniref:Uncharacterized protein n=1 Tax=Clostridium chromiireducens TaxID=225345 RepID=A0A964RNX2_9CLOT|nr:hypothetical protein [Clostridium chromiireducens]MVX65089.1 hypothetical protein [Clostridium chromiireducens]